MAMSRQQRSMLFAACCALAAAPALADRMGHPDLSARPGVAADPCRIVDPGDPHQILGPNPSHAGCLTALYPPVTSLSSSSSAVSLAPSLAPAAPETEGFFSMSVAGTLWLYIVGLSMLVLAGINSRKRHRHLPAAQLSGAYDSAPAHRQVHREGSRWHED